jgi:hypothetical protein
LLVSVLSGEGVGLLVAISSFRTTFFLDNRFVFFF